MSNIFDSLRKAELINADDFPLARPSLGDLAEIQSPSLSEPAAYETSVGVAPSPSIRSINARVSAASPVLPFEEANYAAAEQYRIIRTKILHHPRHPQLLVVSSGGSGDGKTVTSINIAASLALKQEMGVALIDTDMRRPQVAPLLGIESSPGLGEVLAGKATFEEAAVTLGQYPNLTVVPAGEAQRSQTELLDSNRLRALTEQLRSSFDCVIFDAPPIATVADYELVQLVCDGVIVVVRPDHSERKVCLKAIASVPKDKLIGVVLNCVENWFLWRTGTYDSYYTYGSTSKPGKKK